MRYLRTTDVSCHSNELTDGLAQTKPSKLSLCYATSYRIAMTGVPPKASTSWFKDAKKHCMACGKASTKVDRAACKSCGSTVWNLQAVDASQVLCLASLKAPLRLS
jgi:hypothetical protein